MTKLDKYAKVFPISRGEQQFGRPRRESNWPAIRAVAAASIACLALVELPHIFKPGSDLAKTVQVPRCFDKPQPKRFQHGPEPKLPDLSKARTISQLRKMDRQFHKALDKWAYGESAFNIKMEDGLAKGDPIHLPHLEARTNQSIVQISNHEWDGSGFLTTDAHGDEVVVTAAHVVSYGKLSGFKIEGENHVSTHPVSGCYIYEKDGRFRPMPNLLGGEGKIADYDLAVLRLAKPIGAKVLGLSTKPVKKGEWLEFANYQEFHAPGDPANYTGIAISEVHDLLGLGVLTGTKKMQTPLTNGEVWDNTMQAGASGGPVVDLQGDVVGISVKGDKDGLYDNPEILKDLYNVRLTGVKAEAKYGYYPITAGVVPSYLIQKALVSPRG